MRVFLYSPFTFTYRTAFYNTRPYYVKAPHSFHKSACRFDASMAYLLEAVEKWRTEHPCAKPENLLANPPTPAIPQCSCCAVELASPARPHDIARLHPDWYPSSEKEFDVAAAGLKTAAGEFRLCKRKGSKPNITYTRLVEVMVCPRVSFSSTLFSTAGPMRKRESVQGGRPCGNHSRV